MTKSNTPDKQLNDVLAQVTLTRPTLTGGSGDGTYSVEAYRGTRGTVIVEIVAPEDQLDHFNRKAVVASPSPNGPDSPPASLRRTTLGGNSRLFAEVSLPGSYEAYGLKLLE